MKGFTLIELLLVVAIISTITITSSVFYSRFLLQNAVDNTVDQLTGSLRKAQMYSMTGKGGSSWGVNYSNNTITLFKGPAFGGRDPGFDEKFSVNPNVIIDGWNDIYYSRLNGMPTPSALNLTVSGGNNSKSVTVNSQGVVNK